MIYVYIYMFKMVSFKCKTKLEEVFAEHDCLNDLNLWGCATPSFYSHKSWSMSLLQSKKKKERKGDISNIKCNIAMQ